MCHFHQKIGRQIYRIDPWLDNLGSLAFQVSIADRKEA
ncbi:hypothetical protein X557_09085 [Francisella tularensis subsp. holarctica PHIT-FT049]|nr:hypothetical protein X557_09085 [Francisella tularensis subsp. holarctica PHIT-FT049]